MAHHDALFGQDGNLGGAAAHVHDHGAFFLVVFQSHAHHGRQGLVDEHRLSGAYSHRRFQKGSSLHAVDALGHAHNEPWMEEHALQVGAVHDGV